MADTQRQRTGDDSVAIQSGNGTIIKVGLTEVEAHEIFQKLLDREVAHFERLAHSLAHSIAVTRLDQFRTELLTRIQSLERSNLSAFADPDVQMLIDDAQRGYSIGVGVPPQNIGRPYCNTMVPFRPRVSIRGHPRGR